MKTNLSVLIIEDDVWFAEQQMRILQAEGFTVRHVTDGVAGIEAIDESTPDVIVLDVFLPGPNALVLLHELQSYTDLSMLPIIVCTNNAGTLPSGSLAPYGVKTVLDKGLMQPRDLVAAVKRALQ